MWTELVSALLMVFGAFFCLSAAVGILRFPDVITRLHAATKPQVFGLVLIVVAISVRLWSWQVTCLAVLVIAFQVLTAPVSAHMISRTAFRLGLWNQDEAVVDELHEDLEAAGYQVPGGAEEAVAALPARPRRDRG